MQTIHSKVLALFNGGAVVSTDALTDALQVPDNDARTRAIRTRLNRLGIRAEMIGYQAWILTD